MNLTEMVQVATLLSIGGAVFKFAVISPLERTIGKLNAEIAELRHELKRLTLIEIKIAEVSQSVRSAHHRLDTLEAMLK